MAIFERVGAIGRLLIQRGDRPAAPAPAPSGSRVADRERRIAERLLEDEALRGDLDDATWQPVQGWLLARVRLLATSTAAPVASVTARTQPSPSVCRSYTATMVLRERRPAAWLHDLLGGAQPPLTDAEKARRHAETERLIKARDRLPSIAPDTTTDYVRQVRDEADSSR